MAYPENWFEPFTKCESLCFTDGGVPNEEIILDFIKLTRKYKDGSIAVQCQAGFGRTGTMIGVYAMSAFNMQPHAFHAWVRMCRPGSINSPAQERFLDFIWNFLHGSAGSPKRRAAQREDTPLPSRHTSRRALQREDDTDSIDTSPRKSRKMDGDFELSIE